VATKDQIIATALGLVGRADLTARAGEWFDDVYQLILGYADWSFITTRATRATVVNTYRYALPIDFRSPDTLWIDTGDTNSRKLDKKGIPDFHRRYPRLESLAAGYPRDYTVYDDKLLIAPKPSSSSWTMMLIYTYNPVNLTGGQTPIIPDYLMPALRIGLRSFIYADIKSYTKSEADMKIVDGILQAGKKRDEGEDRDELFLKPFMSQEPAPNEYWANPLIMSVS